MCEGFSIKAEWVSPLLFFLTRANALQKVVTWANKRRPTRTPTPTKRNRTKANDETCSVEAVELLGAAHWASCCGQQLRAGYLRLCLLCVSVFCLCGCLPL